MMARDDRDEGDVSNLELGILWVVGVVVMTTVFWLAIVGALFLAGSV